MKKCYEVLRCYRGWCGHFFYSFKTIQWQFAIPVPQEFREEGKKSFNTTNLIITMEY